MADVITIAVEGVKPQCSMLQQFGRCYCQVADEMATTGCFLLYTGRCYYQVADGIATWPVILISVLGCWAEPHPICVADGTCLSFYWEMDYWPLWIMLLLSICWGSGLPFPTMLKFSMVTWWPVVLKWSYIGEGALRCSLNLSLNVLEDSPMYSSSHFTLSHLYL